MSLILLAVEESPGVLKSLGERFDIDHILQIAGVILLFVVVGYLFRRFVLSNFERLAKRTDNDIDDRLVWFLSRFYKGILMFGCLVVILNILDIELTPLFAGAGIIGIGIAYASKDVIANFLSGIFLLVDRPVKLGDRIQIDRIGSQWSQWGDVIDVGLRTSTVKNSDGIVVTYPNAKLAESVIKNFTPRGDPVRFRTRALVDLNTDLARALELMVQAGAAHPAVLATPEVNAVCSSFYNETGGHNHHGALLELRCYLADIRKRTKIRSDILMAIHKSFRDNGICFAHPVVSVADPVGLGGLMAEPPGPE